MVICKFFLQGTCKFGDTCKFEHQVNEHSYAGNSSILLQSYGAKPQTTSNVDTTTLVKAVINDMTSAEKGGQWLLSSYAPFKEKPAFPGFEDHSMEEIRYLFYETAKTGNIEQYKQNLQMMLQQVMLKIKALQNPSPEAVNLLKTIYDTPPSSSFSSNSAQTPFGGAQGASNSVFGGAQQSSSVFVNASQNQSVFGGGNPIQQQPQQNLFGAKSTSVFGNTQNTGNTIFGAQNNQPTQPIFGNPQQKSASIFGGGGSSVFGGTQPSVFGQNQKSTFAQNQQQQSSPFGQQKIPFVQQQQHTSPLGQQQPHTSPLGQQQPHTSPLGQIQPQATPFAQPQQPATPFAQPQQQATPFAQPQQQATPFGQNQQQNAGFGQNQQPSSAIFGQAQQQSSPFGQNQQQSGIFGANKALFSPPQQQQANIFQQNQQLGGQANSTPFGTASTPFGAAQQPTFAQTGNPQIPLNQDNKPSFQHTQNIFGNIGLQQGQGQGNSVFGNVIQNKPNEEFYSKLEELTEEEIKWFQSDDLDIMSIPEKPPTYEMCFRVQ